MSGGNSDWTFLRRFVEQVGIRTRRGLEGLTALVILIFSLFFCHIFIVPLNIFEKWPKPTLYLLAFIAFLGLQLLLFSSDKLYYDDPSKNRYAKAFQAYWPSKHIARKFNLTQQKASYYWFEIFNAWSQPTHQRHIQWQRTLKRGYRCRFIYYSIRFGELLLVGSMVAILTHAFVLRDYSHLYIQLSFSGAVFCLYIVLLIKNATTPNHLKGVWRQYAEINKMHNEWIDQNIVSLDDIRSYTREN